MIMNYDNLHQLSSPFDFTQGYTLPTGDVLFAEDLFNLLKTAMCENHVLGVSAIQLGIAARAFVIGDPTEPNSIIPVFNPTIVSRSEDEDCVEEGCLSFAGLFVKIKRNRQIRTRFANFNGDIDTANFSGITARVFQHEFDHLDGIVYTNKANVFHLERAKKELKNLTRLRKKNSDKVRYSS